MKTYHEPVLLQEILSNINISTGEKYIDATLGGGGHTKEFLLRGALVLGIDQDEESIQYVLSNITSEALKVVRGNFEHIDSIAHGEGFEEVSGILMDLGISSHHVDSGERGFSFLSDAPLDMRMDQRLGVSAADLVNALNKGELIILFTKFGEENFAKSIASHIVNYRKNKRIDTTKELADIVKRAYPRGEYRIHPATKVFQALRIAVNDELGILKNALPKALSLLKPGGRLLVISFHSLEDRIVKEAFREFEQHGQGKILTQKPILPTQEEINRNRRARSAKLRIIEKIKV